MPSPLLTRALGGPPRAVVLRLLVLSFIVGALLFWLDIRPEDIIEWFRRLAWQTWHAGFDGLREAGRYVLVGAMIVVPVWIVLRLVGARSAR